MIDIEPVVFPTDHPAYAMAQSLVSLYADRSGELAELPAICLLARSPVSPISKMIWSHLPSLAQRGCHVRVIFHKRQHQGSARRAAQIYKDAFGDRVFTDIRLADYREVGMMYEELQMGPTIAWSGGRMGDTAFDVSAGDVSDSMTMGQAQMFLHSFDKIWSASESFAEAVGMKGNGRSSVFKSLRIAG